MWQIHELSAGQDSASKIMSSEKGANNATEDMNESSKKVTSNLIPQKFTENSPYAITANKMVNDAINAIGGPVKEEVKSLVFVTITFALEKGVKEETLEKDNFPKKIYIEARDFDKLLGLRELKDPQSGALDREELRENLPTYERLEQEIRNVSKKSKPQSESNKAEEQNKQSREDGRNVDTQKSQGESNNKAQEKGKQPQNDIEYKGFWDNIKDIFR
jgi:hypothetical protein